MTKHTPGPWYARPAAVCTADAVSVCFCESSKRTADEHSANARLISAAPELLAIAKRIHALMESGDMNGRDWTEFNQLDSVIAKAEGRNG